MKVPGMGAAPGGGNGEVLEGGLGSGRGGRGRIER